MTPVQHPDTVQDWKAFKQIKEGGRQAIDTEAMEVYYDTYEATGDKKKAEQAFFNVFKKYRHGSANRSDMPGY